MKTTVINLFGGPCAGKSTTAFLLTGYLKRAGIEADMAPEYAKEIVWSGDQHLLRDHQGYVTAEQIRRIQLPFNKIDFCITDSPLLLGCIYAPKDFPAHYKPYLWDVHNSHTSINFYLKRGDKPYSTKGRNQTYEEAKQLDEQIKDIFDLIKQPKFILDSQNAAEEIFKFLKVITT